MIEYKDTSTKTKNENLKIPDEQNIKAILEFIPYFSDSNNRFFQAVNSKKNEDGIWVMGYVSYDAGVMKFIKSAYNENFVQGFPWEKWQEKAFKYMENPDLLENADIITLVKLFTLILRKDRFCEGFIAELIDDGFILKMLLRLDEIYNAKNSKGDEKMQILPDAFKIKNVFFGAGNTVNIIEIFENKLIFSSQSGRFSSDRVVCKKEIVPSEEEWNEFWDKLNKIDAWNWNKEYSFDRSAIKADGDIIDIIITFGDKNIATHCHCNAPNGLIEFYESLNKLTKLDIQNPDALKS